jgi:hypothetical protein
MFHQNTGKHLSDYMVPHPRTLQSSQTIYFLVVPYKCKSFASHIERGILYLDITEIN